MITTTPTAPPSIVHSYTLRRWDLLRTQMHGLARNRVIVAFFIIFSTLLALLELREPGTAAHSLAFKIVFVIVFDAIFVTAMSILTLLFLSIMILIQRHRGVLGEHTLEVTPSGLMERTEFNETLHRWQGLHRVIRTRHYLYLWVTDSMLHSVPMRSFESEEAVRAFQLAIEAHRKAG